jgi:hypothetical protein
MNIRLERNAANNVHEEKFVKDKSKVLLTTENNIVLNIENKPRAKSETIFDDQFEFVHKRIRFGISCFYKKDAIEKLVKLYQFKKMFLIQSSESPVIKREPMEYPTSERLTESSILKNQVKENSTVMDLNVNDCSVQCPCYI